MTNTTKPGSNQDRVQTVYPKSYCREVNRSHRFAVYISRKSSMILGQGNSAEQAWKDAAKLLR